MSVLNQIKKSELSKKGLTNATGRFEGTPANVAAVLRSGNIPRATTVIPPIELPLDTTFNVKPQPTYLDFIQAATKK